MIWGVWVDLRQVVGASASQSYYVSNDVGVAKIGLAVLLGMIYFHVNVIYGGGEGNPIERVFYKGVLKQIKHFITFHYITLHTED